jgi:hypothetical protein
MKAKLQVGGRNAEGARVRKMQELGFKTQL